MPAAIGAVRALQTPPGFMAKVPLAQPMNGLVTLSSLSADDRFRSRFAQADYLDIVSADFILALGMGLEGLPLHWPPRACAPAARAAGGRPSPAAPASP